MRISVFQGDITEAPADALCTSTNTRLTLMMGTGGAVRERGGFEVLRACEELLVRAGRTQFPPGSAHVTTAGRLPYKAAIHCVASDPSTHISSEGIITACVRNALARADEIGCATLAMPVFATGHARFSFAKAVRTMTSALNAAQTNVAEVVLAVDDRDKATTARQLLET
ncbi:MAG TPA: macro domain-containing protein [Thermoanaerobaculia bacterium]